MRPLLLSAGYLNSQSKIDTPRWHARS